MVDLMVSMASMGRTSLEIGGMKDGEKGMSQLFICLNPAAVVDMDKVDEKMEKTVAFLDGLEAREGMGGVHAPGANLEKTRARNRERGIPVTEATWAKIQELCK